MRAAGVGWVVIGVVVVVVVVVVVLGVDMESVARQEQHSLEVNYSWVGWGGDLPDLGRGPVCALDTAQAALPARARPLDGVAAIARLAMAVVHDDAIARNWRGVRGDRHGWRGGARITNGDVQAAIRHDLAAHSASGRPWLLRSDPRAGCGSARGSAAGR
jgi:hypothetical protein